ncbi:MAG: nucleotidyltransferase domain-containing protein [Nanoarchaeota archaeon]
METELKPGIQKILQCFYKNKREKIHLREIARRTRLNENSVTRFLKQLEKQQILKAEKDANLKKYSLKFNKKTAALLTYADIEKFNKLPAIRRNAIEYFLKYLSEKPIIAIIFGSTAKETYTEKSDIDLLLVVNRRIKTEEAEKYAEAQTGTNISPIQITYEDFIKEKKMKEDHVIQAAMETGYPMTNHILWYEVMYNETF